MFIQLSVDLSNDFKENFGNRKQSHNQKRKKGGKNGGREETERENKRMKEKRMFGVHPKADFLGANVAQWRRQWHPTPVLLPRIPWTEEPGELQSMGSLRVGRDWATSLSLFTFMHWRRKWQPTPVFLPRESQGWGAWWGAVYGVTQSQTWLKQLSGSSSSSNVAQTSGLLAGRCPFQDFMLSSREQQKKQKLKPVPEARRAALAWAPPVYTSF